MTAPPGSMPTSPEALIRPAKAVSDQPQSHIPRKHIREAIRVLLDLGYTATGGEAWRLVKEWRDWRKADCEQFIADEFRSFLQRRGDLLVVRSKRHVDWRVAT